MISISSCFWSVVAIAVMWQNSVLKWLGGDPERTPFMKFYDTMLASVCGALFTLFFTFMLFSNPLVVFGFLTCEFVRRYAVVQYAYGKIRSIVGWFKQKVVYFGMQKYFKIVIFIVGVGVVFYLYRYLFREWREKRKAQRKADIERDVKRAHLRTLMKISKISTGVTQKEIKAKIAELISETTDNHSAKEDHRAIVLINTGVALLSCCVAWMASSSRPLQLWHDFKTWVGLLRSAFGLFRVKECSNKEKCAGGAVKYGPSLCVECAAQKVEDEHLSYDLDHITKHPDKYAQPLATYLIKPHDNNKPVPEWFVGLAMPVKKAIAGLLGMRYTTLMTRTYRVDWNDNAKKWELSEPFSDNDDRASWPRNREHNITEEEIVNHALDSPENKEAVEAHDSMSLSPDVVYVASQVVENDAEPVHPSRKGFIVEDTGKRSCGIIDSGIKIFDKYLPFFSYYKFPCMFLAAFGLLTLGYYYKNKRKGDLQGTCPPVIEESNNADLKLTKFCPTEEYHGVCRTPGCVTLFKHRHYGVRGKDEGRGKKNMHVQKAEKAAIGQKFNAPDRYEKDEQRSEQDKANKEQFEREQAELRKKNQKMRYVAYSAEDIMKAMNGSNPINYVYYDRDTQKEVHVLLKNQREYAQMKQKHPNLRLDDDRYIFARALVPYAWKDLMDSALRFKRDLTDHGYKGLRGAIQSGAINDKEQQVENYLERNYRYDPAKQMWIHEKLPVLESVVKGKEPVFAVPTSPEIEVKDECCHVSDCPAGLGTDAYELCTVRCGGDHCTHWAECKPKYKYDSTKNQVEELKCDDETRTRDESESQIFTNTNGAGYFKELKTGLTVGNGRLIGNYVTTAKHIFLKDGKPNWSFQELVFITDKREMKIIGVDLHDEVDFARVHISPEDLKWAYDHYMSNPKLAPRVKTWSEAKDPVVFGLVTTELGTRTLPGALSYVSSDPFRKSAVFVFHNIESIHGYSGMHIIDRRGNTVAIHKGSTDPGKTNVAVLLQSDLIQAMKVSGLPKNFTRQQ
jgi:hypothetical protein